MIELPEGNVIAHQLNDTITSKVIKNVFANTTPHAFAWYSGNPDSYNSMLAGKKITGANSGTNYTCGGNIEITAEDSLLVLSTPVKYHATGEKRPAKHQLLVEFEDSSAISCTVQMWGAMFCYALDNVQFPNGFTVNRAPSPLSDEFDESYFASLITEKTAKLSAKAFLATEQRIPGLGNGVLQDILFHANIHPKRKMSTLSGGELAALYQSVKSTIYEMTAKGGRDTERDLFGSMGGYQTILSKNTVGKPCPVCGTEIKKEAYLGGAIYYCDVCQSLNG